MLDNYAQPCYSYVRRRKREVIAVSEKDKKIMETFGRIIPQLSDLEKEKLLAFGEGMAFKADQQQAQAGA